ncbi:cadherin-like domain-containing protein [Polaribacter sp. L3A8]|uniref:cadherin-like domain-containing protein n=1 Tax=Polaribacter sp. L3A8 TaxID=2686361 RepID=UPI00131C9585|nr:cadherin-like domain-containing protein [Polaribacter sp. L3A8]
MITPKKNKYRIFIFLLLFSQFVTAQTAPTAEPDSYSTKTNTTLRIDSLGVLANDKDPDGDLLKVTGFSANGNTYSAGDTASLPEGTISIKANGGFIFNPTANDNNITLMVNYIISDGTYTNAADLTLSIINVYPPDPKNDNYTTETNAALNIYAPGLLNNDTDKDGNTLLITSFKIDTISYTVGEKAVFYEGSISINADGSFYFTPASDYNNGIPTINYTVSDGTFTGSANLDIKIINLYPPEAKNNYDTAEINTTLKVDGPGVLINDTDRDNNALSVTEFTVNNITYTIGQTASFIQGSITFKADGSYTFIPTKDYTGNVPAINYTVSDGTFTDTATLYLTVEHITNLIEIKSLSSCNQGYTVDGMYKIKYSTTLTNTSTARDYHATNLIKNIDLTNQLNAIYGNGCVTQVEGVTINTTAVKDYVGNPYPLEFNNDAINDDFFKATSNSIFNQNAINNFTLYPRQSINIEFCVIVNPFCNGRPSPTPSGSGIDFNHVLEVTSTIGSHSTDLLLKDFHTTEAIIAGGLYVPVPKPTVNPDGTFDYTNRVIITNEGTATANNVNYNMGLGNFLDKRIVFNELKITQISGPTVTVNDSYNGNTNTQLLMPNNSLDAGETVILEIFYLTAPFSSSQTNHFNQLQLSQTQGILDGFDETTSANNRGYSFVNWSDSLGNHLDRYYPTNSPINPVSSSLQCSCTSASMVFLFNSLTSNQKTISKIDKIPNGILEHQEITFQLTIKNTSNIVQLENLKLQDNLKNICSGNIVSVSTPFIESSSATTDPTLNPDYNGTSDIDFFNGTSGILMKGESITVQFSVILNEDCLGTNTSVFSATDPLNRVITSRGSVAVNASTDTDNDGITNVTDIDDDNDTIRDIDEYNGLNPLDDHDGDLTPNYRDTDYGVDANNDGIVDLFDFDNDGVPNHFDLDSDNDGILDIVEAGNKASDTNRTGRTNKSVGTNGLDNTVENNDSLTTATNYTIPNTDRSKTPNFIDIDADGDGIVDNIEGQTTANYKAPNGTITDLGIDTAYPNGITPTDTDRDATPDYIDINSDNDIRNDAIEGWDFNNDGIAETIALNLDSDNDGLDDAFDTDNTILNPTNGQIPTDFPNIDTPDGDADDVDRDWREIIAIVVLIDNVTVNESEDAIFTISLVKKNDQSKLIQSASPIHISFTTEDGTDTTEKYNIATAPFDYDKKTAVTLTVPPFTEVDHFTVASLQDLIDELDELFTLNGKITSNNTINTEISGVATILDDDEVPSITMNNAISNEGEDLEHIVTISNPSSRPIYIDINTTNGSAISPDDYNSFYTTLTIEETVDPNNPNIETSFNIPTKIDNLNEPDEFLNVLGVAASTNVGAQDLTKTGTILDINPEPKVLIDNVTVMEGNTLVFTISLVNPDTEEPMQNSLPINFNLNTVNETASDLEDYQNLSTSTSIPAYTASITQAILTIDDNLNENTETMLLQATITSKDISNLSPITFGIGTIEDNDYPNLFTPNGDGKSDEFEINGLSKFPYFKITIMDRWGSEVYTYNNNGDTNPEWWNGTNNGIPVTEGVYYYTLDFNDGITNPKRSFIQLIR